MENKVMGLKNNLEYKIYSMSKHMRITMVVIISLLITLILSFGVTNLVMDNAKNQFQDDSQQIKMTLDDNLNRYYDLVVSLHSFVFSNNEITHDQFDKYIESQSIATKYPAVHHLDLTKYDSYLDKFHTNHINTNPSDNYVMKYINPSNPRYFDENLYKNNQIRKEIEKNQQLKAIISKSNQYPFISIRLGSIKEPLVLGGKDNTYYGSVGATIRLDKALFSNTNANISYIDFQIFSPEDEGKGLIYDSRFSKNDGKISWTKDIFSDENNIFSFERKFNLGGKMFFIKTFNTKMPPNVADLKVVMLFSIIAFIFFFILIYLELFRKIDSKLLSDKNKERLRLLEKQASTDELTQLPNRRAFFKNVEERINNKKTKKQKFFLLFIDLDGFKRVNDTLGHSSGDIVLIDYAKRLSDFSEKHNCDSYRLGGDEFIIVVNCNDKEDLTEEYMDVFAKKVLALTNHPFFIKEESFVLTQSIGIAEYTKDGMTADVLFKNSDMAMYEAKKEGKNTYLFFSRCLFEEWERKSQMSNLLANAIEKKEFHIVYQPKMKLENNKYVIKGVEALLRWNNPKLGAVSPEFFIILAEEGGLMPSIGIWLINEVGKFINEWKQLELGDLPVAVNISAKQFSNKNLAEQYNSILSEYNVTPQNVTIEITETTMMKEPIVTKEVLKKLRDYGFTISVDDFGTGHSSLSYLRQFPVNEIKIDKTFTDDILIDEQDRIIVEGIINMSQKLKLDVVIEGVETKEQVTWLEQQTIQGNGIKIQGYFFSKPLLKEDLIEFYKNNI